MAAAANESHGWLGHGQQRNYVAVRPIHGVVVDQGLEPHLAVDPSSSTTDASDNGPVTLGERSIGWPLASVQLAGCRKTGDRGVGLGACREDHGGEERESRHAYGACCWDVSHERVLVVGVTGPLGDGV
jgi:hypothetical protein